MTALLMIEGHKESSSGSQGEWFRDTPKKRQPAAKVVAVHGGLRGPQAQCYRGGGSLRQAGVGGVGGWLSELGMAAGHGTLLPPST